MSVEKKWESMGRKNAPVTIVEFTDFQCPYCKWFHSEIFAQVKETYIDTGKVRWVNRDFPLKKHIYAFKAAEAARCAGDQKKYWQMYDGLLASDGPPTLEVIRDLASRLSLNTNRFHSCLDSNKFKAAVLKDVSDGESLHTIYTPTFIIAKTSKHQLNGVVIDAALPFKSFQLVIESILQQSR